MQFYQAPYYTEEELAETDERNLHFPFSDKDATYIGKDHQYELTSKYFQERGCNLEVELTGTNPDRVKHFLTALRLKFYTKIYNTNKSSRRQLNYMIAKRGIYGYSPYEYRQAFLEAMFIEGEYLLKNGDISAMAGVDFDTMQNMSEDVMRNQERDFHRDAVALLKALGLRYYGKYKFLTEGTDW